MSDMRVKLGSLYSFTCKDKDGKIIWQRKVSNLITGEGLNDLLSNYFKGAGYSAAFYIGLIDGSNFGAIVRGDTAAQIGGTNSWREFTNLGNVFRPSLVLGAVAAQAVDNSASPAKFHILGDGKLYGAFLTTQPIIGGTDGIIYGETAFPSSLPVTGGGTLSVTITLTTG